MILGEIEVFEDSPWTQDSNGTYIWRSEDTQNNFWTSYNVQLTFSAQEVRKNVHSITDRWKFFGPNCSFSSSGKTIWQSEYQWCNRI